MTIRALVVDDFPFSQELMKELLEALNCSVDVAEDGLQALDQYHVHPYDIIFMDIQMPNMTGYETAKQIRIEENGTKHIPIIALTANFLKQDYDQCFSSGMDDCILKPVNVDELKSILHKYVSN